MFVFLHCPLPSFFSAFFPHFLLLSIRLGLVFGDVEEHKADAGEELADLCQHIEEGSNIEKSVFDPIDPG